MTRMFLVVVVALAGYAGWNWGHTVFPRVGEEPGIGQAARVTGAPVAPETAARATAKIEQFRGSENPELRLESSEVSSLLRYSIPGILPGGVVDPSVSFAEDRIEVSARVLPAGIPDLPQLGGILGLLPDTVEVLVVGALLPSSEKGTLFLIEGIELQGWPVPRRSLPEILSALGRKAQPGVSASAVLVPALWGLKGAHIADGGLVLVRAWQSVDKSARAPRAVRRRAGKALRRGNSTAIRPRSNAERSHGQE